MASVEELYRDLPQALELAAEADMRTMLEAIGKSGLHDLFDTLTIPAPIIEEPEE